MLWGENREDTFVIAAGVLTADPTVNQKIARLSNTSQLIFFVDYAKGTEDDIELFIEFEDKDNLGEFFNLTGRNASGNYIVDSVKITATGKYRLPFPTVLRESRVRVGVKANGSLATPGSVTLTYSTDNLRT